MLRVRSKKPKANLTKNSPCVPHTFNFMNKGMSFVQKTSYCNMSASQVIWVFLRTTISEVHGLLGIAKWGRYFPAPMLGQFNAHGKANNNISRGCLRNFLF